MRAIDWDIVGLGAMAVAIVTAQIGVVASGEVGLAVYGFVMVMLSLRIDDKLPLWLYGDWLTIMWYELHENMTSLHLLFHHHFNQILKANLVRICVFFFS